jgi:apolipoprotein N-acyltransferase
VSKNSYNFCFFNKRCILKKLCLHLQNLAWGALFALGFAPFEQAFFLYFALLIFFHQLQKKPSFQGGLLFGIGLASVGLSWIYVSIHSYGHLNPILSFIFTSLFVLVIGIFYGCFAVLYGKLQAKSSILNPFILASSWCLMEWIRAHIFGGFPWLLIGFSAIHTPFAKLLTVFGLYGPSFALTLAMACFVQVIHRHPQSVLYSCVAVFLFLSPNLIHLPVNQDQEFIDLGIVQGNVAMQDKWNEELFWQHFNRYFLSIQKLVAPNRLIVLPEAAISIPSSYIHQELSALDDLAKNTKSAVLIGIPEASEHHTNEVYNSIMSFGEGQGKYQKRQLVLFGEEIPTMWHSLFKLLHIPIVTTLAGSPHQEPIKVFGQPIASLICYELGYPEVLRNQLPRGKWIVSVSDDGWFGHSFAVYQHLQMAQTLSFMSQRAQLFVNNNGLSSIISAQGNIVKQLPAWKSGKLVGQLKASSTYVPWMSWGDHPIQIIVTLILSLALFRKLMVSSRFRTKNQINPELI